MTLDDELVDEVEAARRKLEGLETAVVDARAEFHQSIRKLHGSGGSMREIATALGMSHQRVHQIIGEDAIVEVEAASTDVTPHPAAPPAASGREDTCSFCGAPRRDVAKLLAAPGRVFVCDACVRRAQTDLQPTAGGAECSFCRQTSQLTFAEGSTVICADCLTTCAQMLRPGEAKRTRRNPMMRCSFCNASQGQVAKLIAGPGVFICGDCVAAAQRVASTGEATPGPRGGSVMLRPAVREPHACSFCAKTTPAVDSIVKGARSRICNECLDVCGSVLSETV
jgi:hypothetical protein